MIVCICRSASESKILSAIDNGANRLRDLQRCGIGDQCGSCHNSLRAMLAVATSDRAACPACTSSPQPAAAAAMA